VCLSFSVSPPLMFREKESRRRWRTVGTRRAGIRDAFSGWSCSLHDQLFAARAPSCHVAGAPSSVPQVRTDVRAGSHHRVDEESITPPRSTVITFHARERLPPVEQRASSLVKSSFAIIVTICEQNSISRRIKIADLK